MRTQWSPARRLLTFAMLTGLMGEYTLPVYCRDEQPVNRDAIAAATGACLATGNLNTARSSHTATLLPGGKVLVAGGYGNTVNYTGTLSSAELYDPDRGTWTVTGGLITARGGHSATLLQNGKVLAAGGSADRYIEANLTSAELYDPVTQTWSLTGSLNLPRFHHTATLLQDGKVLVVGGGVNDRSATAEVYDPNTGTWSITYTLALDNHTATLLPDGSVLVAGGWDENDPNWPTDSSPVSSAERYEPGNGAWAFTGSLITGRVDHSATLLPNGKVLVAGGNDGWNGILNNVELFDPATGGWSLTGSLKTRISEHTATLLANSRVLVAGGTVNGVTIGKANGISNNTALYDPDTETWSGTGSLITARVNHTATLLTTGKVLIAGGVGQNDILASAELYDPDSPIPAPRIITASVQGKKLLVYGDAFDAGAVILLNGEEQATANDSQNPQTLLIARKAGRKIKPGASLRVRNADGALSGEFAFAGT